MQISASKSMGVLLIKKTETSKAMASKQSLLGGYPVSTTQPSERKTGLKTTGH